MGILQNVKVVVAFDDDEGLTEEIREVIVKFVSLNI